MTPRIKNMTPGAAQPTVASGIARALCELAGAMGADTSTLIRSAGLTPEELSHLEHRIPFERYISLMRVARELTREPAFALLFGERFDMADMSIVGLAGRVAENGEDALALLNRFGRLIIETGPPGVDRFALKREGARLWMIDHRANPNDFPELTESTFARMVSMPRKLLGDIAVVKEVHVTHEAPSYRSEYDRIFRVPIMFGSARNALLVDEAWLRGANSAASPYHSGILRAHAETLLAKLDGSKSARGRLEALLPALLTEGRVCLTRMAAELAMSPQSLARQLKAEGTTFGSVLDDFRRRAACDHLTGGGRSVKETAYRLGFSDPASFSRAFKRWTGHSPRGQRRRTGDAA